jgi:hypothetical protein
MLKKKVTKYTGGKLRIMERKALVCRECKVTTVSVSTDITAVVCAYCVQKSVEPPKSVISKPSSDKFPRGWHFKQRYVHTDGRVFCKGVETGEKNTPKPTKKKVVKKKTIKKKRK